MGKNHPGKKGDRKSFESPKGKEIIGDPSTEELFIEKKRENFCGKEEPSGGPSTPEEQVLSWNSKK